MERTQHRIFSVRGWQEGLQHTLIPFTEFLPDTLVAEHCPSAPVIETFAGMEAVSLVRGANSDKIFSHRTLRRAKELEKCSSSIASHLAVKCNGKATVAPEA